jgi:hypothetical protein
MGSMPIWHLPGARHPVLGAGYSALKARQGIANPMLKSVQKIFATLRVDEDPIGTSFTCLVVWMDGDTLVARLQSYSLAVYLIKGSSSMGESMYFLYKKTVCYYLRVGIISLTTQIFLRYLCFWRSIDFFAIIYDLAGIKIPSGYLILLDLQESTRGSQQLEKPSRTLFPVVVLLWIVLNIAQALATKRIIKRKLASMISCIYHKLV